VTASETVIIDHLATLRKDVIAWIPAASEEEKRKNFQLCYDVMRR
jgi:hypothetical protein